MEIAVLIVCCLVLTAPLLAGIILEDAQLHKRPWADPDDDDGSTAGSSKNSAKR